MIAPMPLEVVPDDPVLIAFFLKVGTDSIFSPNLLEQNMLYE
jgi:hypothetical protein